MNCTVYSSLYYTVPCSVQYIVIYCTFYCIVCSNFLQNPLLWGGLFTEIYGYWTCEQPPFSFSFSSSCSSTFPSSLLTSHFYFLTSSLLTIQKSNKTIYSMWQIFHVGSKSWFLLKLTISILSSTLVFRRWHFQDIYIGILKYGMKHVTSCCKLM